MGQTTSFFDLDEADSEQQQKNLQYRSKVSEIEAAGGIDDLSFDDFLARLGDLEKLQYLIPEANAKDQIQTLKMELRFLRTFSKCIARNGNLKDSSASSISAIKKASWGLFSKCPAPGEVSIPVDAISVLSDALEGIKGNRSNIIYFYEQLSASSDSCTEMTVDLALELINGLLQNLKDLLRCKVPMVVAFKSQIFVLKQELQSLQNFLAFAGKRCSEKESLKDLLTHSETVAISLAHLCYTLLADKIDPESSVDMNLKVSDLLQKMKPTKSDIMEIYIGVLKTSQFPEASDVNTIDKNVLEAFVCCLQNYLLEFLNFEFRLKHLIQDQLKVLDEKLRFLRILLMDPPRQYIDLRSIDAVIIVAGLLLFSHNFDEMTEECAMRMKPMLVNLLESMSGIEGLAKAIYLKVSKTFRSKFPMTDGLGFIESFVENLNDLLCRIDTSFSFPRHQIEIIKRDFEFFTSILTDKAKDLNQQDELRSLWTRIMDVAYQTEYVIDSFLVNNGPAWYYIQWLSNVVEEIQILRAEVVEFNTKLVPETKRLSSNAESSEASNPEITERVVGFEDEEDKLIGQLTGGSTQLDIVSLVGMAGLGKTTLSKKIFNSFLHKKHFHVQGWCSVSEVHRKKDILVSLLNQIPPLKEEENKVDDDNLDQVLYQRLKGMKYLIILDDIWNIEAWRDLKISFPDDENGSRIMFTTRHLDVAMKAKLQSDPHSLRPFHDEECWKLLQQLVFADESCDMTLEEIGKQIAKSCKGVPLSVSLIAGILSTNKTWDFWNQVSQSLTSRIFDSPEGHTKDIIEMSYKHLPYHLRPCFLYFGAFLEDQEIPVKILIWLWTAEGFVRKPEGLSIEESAEGYLNILISRSLVTISKRKADGGIKQCRVHDLLFHFCKVKSKEEKFWQLDGFISDYDDVSNESSPDSPTYEQHRLCMYYQGHEFIRSRPLGSHVRSLVLQNPEHNAFFCDPGVVTDISCISKSFRLLKVLDLESINVHVFPDGLEILLLLKYLALSTDIADFIQASIGSLWNLETFVLKALKKVIMPETIWKMRKLRHLYIRGGVIFDSEYQRRSEFFSKPDYFTKLFADTNLQEGLRGQTHASSQEDSNQQILDSLETISNLCLFQGEEEKIMQQIPNVRKLRCTLEDSYDSSSNDNHFPNFKLLSKIESLNVANRRNSRLLFSSESISFPSKLKKLTLTTFNVPMVVISKIGVLNNLEVLKLQVVEFVERSWDMIDEVFRSLRHLELQNVGLEEWNASNENFPCLQRLRLLANYALKEVPSCFGSVQTLQMIEVKNCNSLDMESVWEIQEEQVENGNDEFRVIVS